MKKTIIKRLTSCVLVFTLLVACFAFAKPVEANAGTAYLSTSVGNYTLDGKNHSYNVKISRLPKNYTSRNNIYFTMKVSASGAKITGATATGNAYVKFNNFIYEGFSKDPTRVNSIYTVYTTKGTFTFYMY